MKEVSEDLSHIHAEGIDYSDNSIMVQTDYPDVLDYATEELDINAREFENIDYDDSTLTLYRGDSRESLESFGSFDLDSLEPTGGLSKEFPLYFTTSRAEAIDHAHRKPSDDIYLLEIEVPFQNLDKVTEFTPREVAKNFDQIELGEDTMYFNQSNVARHSLEWIATDIPEKWIKDIDEL